jgi:AcrR family transcriptional regulator
MAQNNANAEKILRVGVHLMAKKGYHATSTREIVEAAGVTKPMLYYYFGSKEGLCLAAIRRFSEQFFNILRAVINAEGDPKELLVDYIWAIFQIMQERRDEWLFFMSLCFGTDRERFLEGVKEIREEGKDLTSQFSEKMVKAGILRPGCEMDFGKALRGMIDIWRWEEVVEGNVLTREIAARIVDHLLVGFGTR